MKAPEKEYARTLSLVRIERKSPPILGPHRTDKMKVWVFSLSVRLGGIGFFSMCMLRG